LHDNITQILATSKLYLDYAFAGPEIKKDIILQSKQLIVLATEELRKLSHSLLPPSLEEFGLTQALNELLTGLSQTDLFNITWNWNGFEERTLSKDQKLTIYRIIQEQLNNIVKHAKAKNVNILLASCPAHGIIKLDVADDGKGFDTTKKRTGVGLRNITSRAELVGGTVEVKSSPGNGCDLNVVFPINNNINSNN
jgi:signal transduction histidine kinase